ncbi:hypothetical protein GAY33_05285 [Azospirillum brasilense]|uniref:beta strand repeat-containing protein n=1 Tax=Azospirillum argentinense TaxID=2970906 RepID=UPI00190A6A78|nr:hypothetical protein [Azospirillum argentinense]MBK3798649.1 hypothetical protein [Azospirillum argentinense]
MAGWYRTGTVSLTTGSATVTGVGNTLWASALRAGMVFTTDFTTLYEIVSVDGDGQLTLDRAWSGSSVGAAQVSTVTITVASPSAAQTSTVTIAGTAYSFTSDATPTIAEIAAGLAARVNLSTTCPMSAAVVAGKLVLTGKTPGQTVTVSVGANLALATTAAVATSAYAVIFGGAAISNAEVVAELMTMVGKWQTREDQYDDWLAGEPDGGPNGDGKYPLTDSKGVTRLVTSPGRLLSLIDDGLLDNVQQVVDMIEDDVTAAQQAADKADSAAVTLAAYVASASQDRQAAETARDASALSASAAKASELTSKASETAAAGSASTASAATAVATGARDAALAAKTATEQARDTTLAARDVTTAARDMTVQARDVATQARDQAVASQTAAAASQARSQDAMSTAVNAAADSVDAKIHAVNAQTVAEQRRNEASGFADTAKAWATNPVGQPVTSGALSAYHWAEQSRTYAQQAQVIAGGYMFGAVGDGSASRISAQAAADVLHLVQGAGMIINFDQATRKVTFSSIARAVASEDPAVTVRLDEAAALAYLGLDRSKINHATLAGVGTHGHADIDAHLDNATIHVPVPGSGDVDKLLKATGAGTFAWAKGAGSGIDADKLDGLSWEEGIEVAGSNAAADWIKLGTWAATSAGRRLLIQATGSGGYANNAAAERGGVTLVSATIGNNNSTAVANIQGALVYLDNPLLAGVKFKQGANRYTYDVFVQRAAYAAFNYRVSTSGTWTHAGTTGQTDPGADSATVRAAVNLGRLITTTEVAQGATANTLAQRAGDGTITASGLYTSGPAPAYNWYESDYTAVADAKRWYAQANNGSLAFGVNSDDWSVGKAWLGVDRNGATPTKATFSVPVDIISSNSDGMRVLRADGNRYAFLGYHATAEYGRIGAYGGSAWRNLTINDGGSLVAVGTTTMPTGAAKMNVAGGIQVDGSLVWTAATFDPATKAGTSVATVAANGLMAAADKAMMNNATASATAGALVRRDDNGAAQFTDLRIGGNTVLTTANGAALSGATFTGNVSLTKTGGSSLVLNGSGTNAIELGRTDGTTSTPVIDFHSGAAATDYDARLVASGGTGTNAGGTLNAQAATFQHNGNAVLTTANGAQLAVSNTFTGNQTISNTQPGLNLTQTNGGTDGKRWLFEARDGTTFRGLLVNDGGSVFNPWIAVTRAGTTSAAIALTSTAFTHNGNAVYTSGNLTGAWLGQDVRTTANPTFNQLVVSSTSSFRGQATFERNTAATDAQVYIQPGSGTINQDSKLRFGATFGTGSDTGSRLAATLRAGFNGAAWGTEYLDVYINDGTANDSASDTAQTRVLRTTKDGLQVAGAVSVNGNTALHAGNAVAYGRNKVRNSRLRIAQRGIGPWTVGGYTADGYTLSLSGVYGSGAVTVSLIADTSAASRSNNMLEVKMASVPSAPAAGDFMGVYVPVEGVLIDDLAWGTATAKPLTLSFRVDTNKAGTYSLAIRNGLVNYSCVKTYNLVSGTNVVTVTFPGPTAGTWYTDNRTGLGLYFGFAGGASNKTAIYDTWQAVNVFIANAGTDFVAQAGNYYRLTDLVMATGSTILPAAAYDKPIMEDLRDCQRYYAKIDVDWCGYVPIGYSGITTVSLPVPMRDLPSCTHSITASDNLNYLMNYGTFSNSVRATFAGPASGMMRALYYLYASAEL